MAKDPGMVKRPRLSSVIVDALQRQILSGALVLGDRLPTEQQMILQFGVSRTVVREAISGLRANGLVEARQGSGVFVTGKRSMIDLGFISGEIASLSSVLDLLELRTPIEVEAAGLAAIRRSSGQDADICMAFDRLGEMIERGENSINADFELHLTIVQATNNRHFIDVLTFLGQKTIPRSHLFQVPENDAKAYLRRVHAEHGRIVKAISAQDAEGAREEMRQHLVGSYQRYRALTLRA